MSAKSHTVTCRIISRNPNVWEAKCGRHAVWTGPTYEAVEDQWREHVHAETGVEAKAYGDTSIPRWSA